jgi:ABC-type sulfate transport system permease component
MPRSTLGLLVGLALGFALVFGSFGDMLVVALFGAIGFAVSKVIDGELDLAPYLSGLRRDR